MDLTDQRFAAEVINSGEPTVQDEDDRVWWLGGRARINLECMIYNLPIYAY